MATKAFRNAASRQGFQIYTAVQSRSAIPGMLSALPAALRAESRLAAEAYRKAIDEAFETHGWGAWQELSPETIASKRRRGSATPEEQLREFDQLRESIHVTEGGARSAGMAEFLFSVGPDQSQHRDSDMTNEQLGLVHEFGDPSHNIPERSFLRLSADHEGGTILEASILAQDAIITALVPRALAAAPIITYTTGVASTATPTG